MPSPMLSPFPSHAQSIVGVAGGATRAAIVQHQARRDNMADVAAKDSSQASDLTQHLFPSLSISYA